MLEKPVSYIRYGIVSVCARTWEDEKRRMKTEHRRPSATILVTMASYTYDRKEKSMLLATVSNVVVDGLAFVGAKTNDCIQMGAHQQRRQPSSEKKEERMRIGAERCRCSTVSCVHVHVDPVFCHFPLPDMRVKRTMQKNEINRFFSD